MKRRVKRRGYIVSAQVCFVPSPIVEATWIKTHPCVLVVSCSWCMSARFEPCKKVYGIRSHVRLGSHGDYQGETHAVRRRAAKELPLRIEAIEVRLA